MHVYEEVRPIVFKGAYSQGSVHRVIALTVVLLIPANTEPLASLWSLVPFCIYISGHERQHKKIQKYN